MFAQAGLRFDRDFLNNVFFSGRGAVFQFYSRPSTGTPFQQQPPGSSATIYKPNWLERMLSRIMARLGRSLLKRILGIEYSPNLDLTTELELTSTEAASGGEREIKYQRGNRRKKLVVKIPAGVSRGTKIRLKGMGLTEKKKTGDLYLHIQVRDRPSLER
ncbi:MAG: hypothetical protein KAI14_04805 [Dehalococcoidales bacterium]|nr:hypothetical protein [Dehalococcoidales bacterium]